MRKPRRKNPNYGTKTATEYWCDPSRLNVMIKGKGKYGKRNKCDVLRAMPQRKKGVPQNAINPAPTQNPVDGLLGTVADALKGIPGVGNFAAGVAGQPSPENEEYDVFKEADRLGRIKRQKVADEARERLGLPPIIPEPREDKPNTKGKSWWDNYSRDRWEPIDAGNVEQQQKYWFAFDIGDVGAGRLDNISKRLVE